MQNKPNFTVIDANVTKSGKFIRAYGTYDPDGEGKVRSDSILLDVDKFESLSKTPVEENGKTYQKVPGLVGAVFQNPVLEPLPLPKTSEADQTRFLVYLSETKIAFPNGMSMDYNVPSHKRERASEQDQEQTGAAAPGM